MLDKWVILKPQQKINSNNLDCLDLSSLSSFNLNAINLLDQKMMNYDIYFEVDEEGTEEGTGQGRGVTEQPDPNAD